MTMSIVAKPRPAEPKTGARDLVQFFHDRYPHMASERGSVDLTALFTALGGAVSAVTVFMQTAGIDKLNEGPRAKLKVAAVTVVAALAGVVAGNQIGTVVQDTVASFVPPPEVICVSQELAPRSDGVREPASGFIQIGPAAAQTRDTVMPLPPRTDCSEFKTVRVANNIEALAGNQTGACTDIFATVTDPESGELEERLLGAYVTEDVGAEAGKPLVVLPVDPQTGEPIACGPTSEVLSIDDVPVTQSDGFDFGG